MQGDRVVEITLLKIKHQILVDINVIIAYIVFSRERMAQF
jgi:hypothetical protein